VDAAQAITQWSWSQELAQVGAVFRRMLASVRPMASGSSQAEMSKATQPPAIAAVLWVMVALSRSSMLAQE